MKHIITSLLVAAAAVSPASAQGQAGKVRIKGELQWLKDTLIVFSPTAQGEMRRDTVLTPGGKFDFTLQLDRPRTIAAYTPATLRRQENIALQAIAVPGEEAVIQGGEGMSYYFSGSRFYEQYNEADRAMEAAGQPLRELTESLNKRIEAGESQETLMQEYRAKAPALQQQVTEAMLAFIRQHPDYEASAAVAAQLGKLEAIRQGVALLSPAVREGRMKPVYEEVVSEMEQNERQEAEAAAKQAAGVVAPDFTLDDIQGKPLSLASLRGKYVLLDFWGSWCIWCIRGIPQMKAYYEKYKDRMEILGIDCNDTPEKWKAAVEKYSLPWLHVYNPRGGKVLADYAVQGFPTKVLVGPDGKIVRTVVGEDPAFYTYLDELFGK